jgi:recombinational DNA repair protein RecR
MRYSAGILLYKHCDDTLYLLLGKDVRYNLWSDFGGSCEDNDKGESINTASREFYEETIGGISDECELRFQLKQYALCLNCESYKRNRYYMYVMDTSNVIRVVEDIVDDFNYQHFLIGKTNVNPFKKFKEKYQIDWFSIEYVVQNPKLFRVVFYTSLTENIDTIRNYVKTSVVDA